MIYFNDRCFYFSMVIAFLFLLFSFNSIADESGTTGINEKDFVVLESLLYTDSPNFSKYNIYHVGALGSPSRFWPNGYNQDVDFPSEKSVKDIANDSIANQLYYIDIEHLPTSTNDEPELWNESIAKLTSVLGWVRSQSPGMRVGLYDVLPERMYWNRDKKWRDRNKYFARLVKHVDVIYPSLYTFYDDPDEWVIFAIDNIKEARQYGKPVYVFLWPEYHDGGKLKGTYIDAKFWRLQLETCYKYADGIVVWGGYKQNWSHFSNASDKNNWWYQTLDFMRSHELL